MISQQPRSHRFCSLGLKRLPRRGPGGKQYPMEFSGASLELNKSHLFFSNCIYHIKLVTIPGSTRLYDEAGTKSNSPDCRPIKTFKLRKIKIKLPESCIQNRTHWRQRYLTNILCMIGRGHSASGAKILQNAFPRILRSM